MNNIILNRIITRLIVFVGIVLPWIVGVGVKLYAQSHGRPTFDWSCFFDDPLIVLFELWATTWFAIPFLVLALGARWLFAGGRPLISRFTVSERRVIVLAGFSGGIVGSVRVFIELFWNLDPLVFAFPFYVPLHCVVDMFIGLTAGFVMVTVARVVRAIRSEGSS